MIQRIRVAMLSLHSCPLGELGTKDTGGMNVYVLELARDLGRMGHSVDIYTRKHQGKHKRMVYVGQNVRLIHLDSGGGGEIPKLALYPFLSDFVEDIEDFRELNCLQYDLIHCHYWLSGLAGGQLKARWHVPCLTMFHTLGAVKNSLSLYDNMESALRVESERKVVDSCDCLIAATARERDELICHYNASPSKIAIVPCGVNLELFRPINDKLARGELGLDHQRAILFVGRIDPVKGLNQLLRALPHITCADPIKLVVVGGGRRDMSELFAMQKMAQDLAVEDRVDFIGSVSQEWLPLFYSAVDACVIPSYYESFGMVALESLACGTPVVATDVGSIRQLICNSDMGYIIPDNSAESLSVGISEVLQRSRKHERHIEMRRGRVTEFGWSSISRLIFWQYEAALGKPDFRVACS